MEGIWASTAAGVVNDLEIVTHDIEEHLEMNPYPVLRKACFH